MRRKLHFVRRIHDIGGQHRSWHHGFVEYEIEIKDDALAALRKMPEDLRRQIGFRLHQLQNDLAGDVKKLKGSKNEYRLRVGSCRVLFELDGRRIVVYDAGQRKDIYQ
jgi:mRNA interferase RelE/StbE